MLRKEMRAQVARMEAFQENLKTAMAVSVKGAYEEGEEIAAETGVAAGGGSWEGAANDALLAAGLVDGLKKDTILIVSGLCH